MNPTLPLIDNEKTDSQFPKLWWKNSESEQILNRGYLLKGETVEGAIDRICTAAAKRLYKPELKESFQEMIERGWMSLSSPIWANMGTERGLPISCFNTFLSAFAKVLLTLIFITFLIFELLNCNSFGLNSLLI